MSIDHVCIVVKDIKKAKAFFVDLGFTAKKQSTLEGTWMDILMNLQNVKAEYTALGFPDGQTNLELLTFSSPEILLDNDISKPNAQGFRHIAIAVENIDEEVTKLKTKRINLLSDIQDNGMGKRLCYFLGPEGILLELAEYK